MSGKLKIAESKDQSNTHFALFEFQKIPRK